MCGACMTAYQSHIQGSSSPRKIYIDFLTIKGGTDGCPETYSYQCDDSEERRLQNRLYIFKIQNVTTRGFTRAYHQSLRELD